MATETLASDHTYTTDEQIEKKENEEAIGQKAISLSNEDEDKHDKPEDVQGLVTPLSKTEGEAEGDEKAELAVVEVDRFDDSPALEASTEDNLKHDKVEDAQGQATFLSKEAEIDEKKAEVVVAEVEKSDESPTFEASTEDNQKHDKVEGAQGLANPSSKTEEVEGDEKKAELAAVEVEKSDDSPVLQVSAEDNLKHDKVEDAQGVATPSSKTEGDEKAELAVVEVEKSDDSPALEASAEDNLKQDKVEDAQGLTAPFSKTEGETEEDEKAEPAVVVVEKIDDSPSVEASVADNLKEEKELIPDSQTISVKEPEHDAAKSQPEEPPSTEPTVKETPQQLGKESTETEEEKQHQTAYIPESSAETIEKSSDAIEVYPLTESEAEVAKETEILETSSLKVEKPEPVVTEVQEKSEEPEKESQEKAQDAEQPNTVAIPEPSAETNEKPSDAIEEKTRESEFEAKALKETNNYEAGPTVTEKAETVVTEVEEKPSEPEKQSFQQEEEEQPKMVIPETETESDTVEVHPSKESDIEVVKENVNSESEAVPGKVEKRELVSTDVEEKPREQLEVAEEVGETSKEVETKEELLLETAKSEWTSDDIVKEPISLKEGKNDTEDETGITGYTAQVSLNEEAQAAPTILVDSSPGVAENVVEEDDKKESSFTDVIEGVSKEEVVGVLKNPQQASISQEAETDLKEEREYSAPTSVEEKVAANDDKKEPEVPDAVKGSSREVEVEIKKIEEQTEAKTTTTEARDVKDDGPAVDNEKEGQAETKVDEVAKAGSDPVRETLASKFEEEDPVKTEVEIPEPPTKESDATKTSKDLPKETAAKPAQKQSSNIISKVKQSLVKAKKALTGKSPSSKTLSSEAKDDTIKVK